MAVIVISCGRTGTNVALSILSGNSNLKPDGVVENKNIFKNIKSYNKKYLVKTDVTYLPNYNSLKNLMNKNPNMFMVWTIRDPRDVIISKIRRGQGKKDGGDNPSNNIFTDATPKGAEDSLRRMVNIYKKCVDDYPERIFLVKMEDMLMNTETISKEMCDFIGIKYQPNMVNFPSRMKNTWKVKRYGNKIDKKQVGLWKNWKTIYNGFFKKNKYNLEPTFKRVGDLVKHFNYD